MTKNLVVGAGFSGAVIANLLAAELNEKVVVADRRENLAGNCYDFRDKNGIMIHKYGSHIFHTSSCSSSQLGSCSGAISRRANSSWR